MKFMAVCGFAYVFDRILLCILVSGRFAREIRGDKVCSLN